MSQSNQQSNSTELDLEGFFNTIASAAYLAGQAGKPYGWDDAALLVKEAKATLEANYLPREQVEAAIGPDDTPTKTNAHIDIEREGRNKLRQEIRSKLGLNTKDKESL